MSFEPGKPRSPNAGRKAGVPNKRTQELIDKASELGCSPFEILLRFAMGDYEWLGYNEMSERTSKTGDKVLEPTISPELRCSAAEKAASYIYPKLKAIEHTGEAHQQVFVQVTKESVLEALKQDPMLASDD